MLQYTRTVFEYSTHGIILFRYSMAMPEYMVRLAYVMEPDALLGSICRLGRSPAVV